MTESSLFRGLFSLEGKCALVTGASGGIGRVLSVCLAQAGARLAINGATISRLEATQRLIETAKGHAVVLPADLSRTESCQRLVADACESLGSVDILVNCVGINSRKAIEDVTSADFDNLIDVNLRSVFFVSQAACRCMKRRGGGKIINIGSVTSHIGLANLSIYGMTKSAIAQLTKTMAVEWAKHNIQVNCLAPGFLQTPLTEAYFWNNARRRQWLLERIPARRPGKPEDLIGCLLLLASPASSYMTGQIITVDGGFLCGGSWESDPV